MDIIRKIIQEEIRKILSENYPVGAAQDPSAPWNQVDNIKVGEKAQQIKYNVVWTDNSEFAFVKDATGNLYLFYIGAIDKKDFAPYADREEEYFGRDEDGDPIVDYDDNWEITDDVVENYLNDNLGAIKIGKGFEDYENGFELVMIDDELKLDLINLTKYFKDERKKSEFLNILNPNSVNEVDASEKLINKKTMDTPTGTLFIMNVSENESKTNHKRRD